MLDVKSDTVFPIVRLIPLHYFEGARIINAINSFFLYLKIQLTIQRY